MMETRIRPVLAREAIARRVAELGAQLSRDYRGLEPVFVGILKGAFIFLADLVRALEFPVEVDFIRAASYGAGTESTGKIRVTKDVELPLAGRHVLLVEDIVDAGYTLDFLRRHLAARGPASLKICCLIDKRERRRVEVPLDYVGFVVPEGFLVGYGLDCGEKLRTLPAVYAVDTEGESCTP